MLLFHVTSPAAADTILAGGFRDGNHMLGRRGVSLLDFPTRDTQGDGVRATGAVLEVEVPEAVAAQHEVLEDAGDADLQDIDTDVPDVERWVVLHWLVPAELLNTFPRRVLTAAEAAEWAERPLPSPTLP